MKEFYKKHRMEITIITVLLINLFIDLYQGKATPINIIFSVILCGYIYFSWYRTM